MATRPVFQAGSFYFPTSTGTFTVYKPEWRFRPQGILFFGGNQDTEDTLIHPTAPGVFFGMAWMDVDTGLVDYQANAITTLGWRFRPHPILCLSSDTTVEYEASSITLDQHGFTLNVTTAAPGDRLIHYLTWGGLYGAEGKSVGTDGGANFDFTSLGYRPLSSVLFSLFAGDAVREDDVDDVLYHTMGCANFPTVDTDTYNNNAGAIAFKWDTGAATGFTQQYQNVFDTAIAPSVAPGPALTWESHVDHLRPYPNWDSEALRLSLSGWPNRAQVAWMTCEGSVHSVSTPDLASTSTTTAAYYIDEIQAALFFGTTGYGSEAIIGTNAAYVFGVLTDDYQGVVAFDTGVGDSPADGTKSFFQSQAACFANSLSPGGGIRVASGVINDNQVILTGEIASNTQIGQSYMQVWGNPVLLPNPWTPNIYRRVFR